MAQYTADTMMETFLLPNGSRLYAYEECYFENELCSRLVFLTEDGVEVSYKEATAMLTIEDIQEVDIWRKEIEISNYANEMASVI